MKIKLVSHSDLSGGAARAAYRLHKSLLAADVESSMLVRVKKSGCHLIQSALSNIGKAVNLARYPIGNLCSRLQSTSNVNLHSVNILPSRWAKILNYSDAAVINLHWIAGEAMSIEDIGKIKKPVVWTLHDMWAFCGAEHYSLDSRQKFGYTPSNRLAGHSGLDIDMWVWKRKRKAWNNNMYVVCPSRWLAECARKSKMMGGWDVRVIPNPLDTSVFKPISGSFARSALNLPQETKLVLFGAIGGGEDPRKGYDLLLDALNCLPINLIGGDLMFVVFGQDEPENPPKLPVSVRWMGRVYDDASLVLLYNSADVMVVPSRQENLPQTGTEAQACGCPVVAFNATGLSDVVEHEVTGYLAKPYDPIDMAHGIFWVLEDKKRHSRLGLAARSRAVNLWSFDVVVPQYLGVYRDAISKVVQ